MKIELDEKYLPILSAALVEMPYRVSAPLINEINQQLIEKRKNQTSTHFDENGIEISQ